MQQCETCGAEIAVRFAFLRAVWKPVEENLLSIFRRRRSDDRRYGCF